MEKGENICVSLFEGLVGEVGVDLSRKLVGNERWFPIGRDVILFTLVGNVFDYRTIFTVFQRDEDLLRERDEDLLRERDEDLRGL